MEKEVSLKANENDVGAEADILEKQLQEDEQQLQWSIFNDKKNEEELIKANHTKNQKALYNAFLETRVRLQKAIAIANRFPQPDNYSLFLRDPNLSSKFMESSSKLKCLLVELFALQQELKVRNKHTESFVFKKRSYQLENPTESMKNQSTTLLDGIDCCTLSSSSLWKMLEQETSRFVSFEEEMIDKWNLRVELSSGRYIGKQFKAVNQSILKQIKQLLFDKQRLRRRTQLKRTSFTVIGKKTKDVSPVVIEHNSKNKEEVQNNISSKTLSIDNYDEELFDDNDFFHQILKEVIDSGSNVNLDPSTIENHQISKKTKRRVEHRSTKDKRLRYQIHEKLVGFMTASNSAFAMHSLDNREEDLFNNLFKGVSDRSVQ